MLQQSKPILFIALCFCFFIATNPVHSQQTTSYTITWNDSLISKELNDFKVHKVLAFDGSVYDYNRFGNLPLFVTRIPLGQFGQANVQISNAHYEPLPNALVAAADNNKIPSQQIISTDVNTERHKHFANVVLMPFAMNSKSGKLERLVSFDLTCTVTPISNVKKPGMTRSTFATTSVLATGTWYKFGVQQDGVYKINKSYLQTLGINVSSINPQNIRIYGNGGGMLPEPNAAPRLDDLTENAIFVSGQDDGQFNDDDYILFYGQSPTRWSYDSTLHRYSHQTNLYSDFTYYFINVDLGLGKRILTQPQESQAPTATVNTFDEHLFHEAELKNLIASGREWFGEEFQFSTDQLFDFTIPNPVSGTQAEVKMSVASRSIGSSKNFGVSINGSSYGAISINGISGSTEDYYAFSKEATYTPALTTGNLSIGLSYSNPNNDANGWLNYIEVNAKRQLIMNGSQMTFRSMDNVGSGNVTEFDLSNASNALVVWDVTSPTDVKTQEYSLNGTTAQFKVVTPELKEFIAFNGGYLTPTAGTKVENQNLHASGATDYVIVTTDELKPAADALADFHSGNMQVKVVTVGQLYNEFASGAQDITAIRDYMKMLYDRAAQNGYDAPKYLMLFGDASYDYKARLNDNTNLVPTYESYEVLNPTATFCSDDYFVLLDDNEGGSLLANSALDLSVGRLPVATVDEGFAMVNKIKVYASAANQGSWQNVITMAADDDPNVFLSDADALATYINTNYPVWNVDKIYLDAFKQIIAPAGQRAPDVNTAIRNRIYNGTLIFNYQGHGGPIGLAHERILMASDFDSWNNCNRMPLFITATCEFSRFDDPSLRAAGELLVLKSDGGAIALVTTLRLVYQGANTTLNNAFTHEIVKPQNGYYGTIGDAFRIGKNNALPTAEVNTRKFALLGDPALTLDYPHYNAVTTEVDNHPVDVNTDTLKALQKVTIKGKVVDNNGNVLTTFSGRVYPTVFDKAQDILTFGDGGSTPTTFKLQKNIIYRGKASVTNGLFTYTFIVPKDISYQVGYGKISYFAEDGNTDANGYTNLYVGGTADSAAVDTKGPTVKLYMNNEKFVYGGLTDPNPTILLKVVDESGINTTGNGIGHDITGALDENQQNSFVMNDFYEANQDDYTSGTVRYPLKDISTGRHSLDVKCWDAYNNSALATTEFIVASSANMALEHVLNYPNPFTTSTEFMFEHNMPGANLDVKVEIFTVSGKLIKTIHTNILSTDAVQSGGFCSMDVAGSGGYRVDGIMWDGSDDYGDPIGKGVYVYRVSVRGDNGLSADKFEKLVVLK